MAFWGTLVKPENPIRVSFREAPRTRLQLCQATLEDRNDVIDDNRRSRSKLYCQVGNDPAIAICSLIRMKSESCQLNLEFGGPEAEDTIFYVCGVHDIALTGCLTEDPPPANLEISTIDASNKEVVDGAVEHSPLQLLPIMDSHQTRDGPNKSKHVSFKEVGSSEDSLPEASQLQLSLGSSLPTGVEGLESIMLQSAMLKQVAQESNLGRDGISLETIVKTDEPLSLGNVLQEEGNENVGVDFNIHEVLNENGMANSKADKCTQSNDADKVTCALQGEITQGDDSLRPKSICRNLAFEFSEKNPNQQNNDKSLISSDAAEVSSTGLEETVGQVSKNDKDAEKHTSHLPVEENGCQRDDSMKPKAICRNLAFEFLEENPNQQNNDKRLISSDAAEVSSKGLEETVGQVTNNDKDAEEHTSHLPVEENGSQSDVPIGQEAAIMSPQPLINEDIQQPEKQLEYKDQEVPIPSNAGNGEMDVIDIQNVQEECPQGPEELRSEVEGIAVQVVVCNNDDSVEIEEENLHAGDNTAKDGGELAPNSPVEGNVKQSTKERKHNTGEHKSIKKTVERLKDKRGPKCMTNDPQLCDKEILEHSKKKKKAKEQLVPADEATIDGDNLVDPNNLSVLKEDKVLEPKKRKRAKVKSASTDSQVVTAGASEPIESDQQKTRVDGDNLVDPNNLSVLGEDKVLEPKKRKREKVKSRSTDSQLVTAGASEPIESDQQKTRVDGDNLVDPNNLSVLGEDKVLEPKKRKREKVKSRSTDSQLVTAGASEPIESDQQKTRVDGDNLVDPNNLSVLGEDKVLEPKKRKREKVKSRSTDSQLVTAGASEPIESDQQKTRVDGEGPECMENDSQLRKEEKVKCRKDKKCREKMKKKNAEEPMVAAEEATTGVESCMHGLRENSVEPNDASELMEDQLPEPKKKKRRTKEKPMTNGNVKVNHEDRVVNLSVGANMELRCEQDYTVAHNQPSEIVQQANMEIRCEQDTSATVEGDWSEKVNHVLAALSNEDASLANDGDMSLASGEAPLVDIGRNGDRETKEKEVHVTLPFAPAYNTIPGDSTAVPSASSPKEINPDKSQDQDILHRNCEAGPARKQETVTKGSNNTRMIVCGLAVQLPPVPRPKRTRGK